MGKTVKIASSVEESRGCILPPLSVMGHIRKTVATYGSYECTSLKKEQCKEDG